jgi:hypothetical protein
VLHPLTHILGTTVMAVDGEAGTLRDVYVDAVRWRVVALVLDLAVPQATRPVLVPATAVRHWDVGRQHLDVELTAQEVLEAPRVDPYEGPSPEPGWPPDWYSPSARWPRPLTLGDEVLAEGEEAGGSDDRVSALRAAGALIGYRLRSGGDEIGHLTDLLVEDDSWRIRCLLFDPGAETGGTSALPASRVRAIDDESRLLVLTPQTRQARLGGDVDCEAA